MESFYGLSIWRSPRRLKLRAPEAIHYFELLWTPEVWASLVANTNKYAKSKIVLEKQRNPQKKGRWWMPVNLYDLLLYYLATTWPQAAYHSYVVAYFIGCCLLEEEKLYIGL